MSIERGGPTPEETERTQLSAEEIEHILTGVFEEGLESLLKTGERTQEDVDMFGMLDVLFWQAKEQIDMLKSKGGDTSAIEELFKKTTAKFLRAGVVMMSKSIKN